MFTMAPLNQSIMNTGSKKVKKCSLNYKEQEKMPCLVFVPSQTERCLFYTTSQASSGCPRKPHVLIINLFRPFYFIIYPYQKWEKA